MSSAGIITIVLIVSTVLVSYKGFKDTLFFDKYKFQVDKILAYKDYKRLVTSGFLHVSWMHLLFNMFSLYIFSGLVEGGLGSLNFLLIYFASLIGGGLVSLLIHRHHGDYSSVGASGAVWGVLFACVALYPGMTISLFPIPLSIPVWLYALLFVLFTIYAIRSKKNNIGNESHLGGAIVGMALALLINPMALAENYGKILIVLLPAAAFLYLIITRPHVLLIDNLFYKIHHNYYSIDHHYNVEKHDQQQEIDRILDKINKRGMRSLNKREKDTLEAYSKSVR
jgi:membrane associated rhomboid family serine protease